MITGTVRLIWRLRFGFLAQVVLIALVVILAELGNASLRAMNAQNLPGVGCDRTVSALTVESNSGTTQSRVDWETARVLVSASKDRLIAEARARVPVRLNGSTVSREISVLSSGAASQLCLRLSNDLNDRGIVVAREVAQLTPTATIADFPVNVAATADAFRGLTPVIGSQTAWFFGDATTVPGLQFLYEPGARTWRLYAVDGPELAPLETLLTSLNERYAAVLDGVAYSIGNPALGESSQEVLQQLAVVFLLASSIVALLVLLNLGLLNVAVAPVIKQSLNTRRMLGAPRTHLLTFLSVEPLVLGLLVLVATFLLSSGAHELAAMALEDKFAGIALRHQQDWRMRLALVVFLTFAVWLMRLSAISTSGSSSGIAWMALRMQPWLVALQAILATLSICVALSAVLAYRSMLPEGFGFDPAGLVVTRIEVPGGSEHPEFSRRVEQFTRELRSQGIEVAVSSLTQPLAGTGSEPGRIQIDGRSFDVMLNRVSANFFDVLRLNVIGEVWTAESAISEHLTEPSALIMNSRAAATGEIANISLVGLATMWTQHADTDAILSRVTGFVDEQSNGIEGRTRGSLAPSVYIPLSRIHWGLETAYLWTRPTDDVERQRTRSLLGEHLPLLGAGARVVEDLTALAVMAQARSRERSSAMLFSMMSLGMLTLAFVGLAGQLSLALRHRRRGDAIRMALGEEKRTLALRAVAGISLPLFIGLAFGTIGSWIVLQLLDTSAERGLDSGLWPGVLLSSMFLAILLCIFAWSVQRIDAAQLSQIDLS